MIEAKRLVTSYVEGLRKLYGACGASLFVPASMATSGGSFFVSDGEQLVPHLSDEQSATRFSATSGTQPWIQIRNEEQIGWLPTPDPGCFLFPLASLSEMAPKRRRRDSDLSGEETQQLLLGDQPVAGWIGLRFDPQAVADDPTALLDPASLEAWWAWTVQLGSGIARFASKAANVLVDPTTGLPDRSELQSVLAENLQRAKRLDRPLGLLFVNPDDFAVVNEKFGSEAGDSILREIADELARLLRTSDPLARYGGAIFAAILPNATPEAAAAVAQKMLKELSERSFLKGAVRLGFSIGMAYYDPNDQTVREPMDLFLRADQALNSVKRRGGGGVFDWEAGSHGSNEGGNFDRLSGIFTGNMAKDYGNMVLLWDFVDLIASNASFETLANEAMGRIGRRFKPQRLALFFGSKPGEMELVKAMNRPASGTLSESESFSLSDSEKELVRQSIQSASVADERLPADSNSAPGSRYAVPLLARDQCLGVVFMDCRGPLGSEGDASLDASDMIFLKGLSSQLAIAFDQAQLAELDRKRQEKERKNLHAELDELREALQHAKLVYRSPQMDGLLTTARRVAPTDATVLITGESGTGKELVAHTIHELSPRRKSPLVVVDCGTIPTTLIESELFGAERGAYTGAQQRKVGRLTEANGGTVLLDEIGELPLEVQSKLLRFVQEKQLMAVGGSRPRKVDVRILAATNRDLAGEVSAGTFREDLYYRLNVVRLEVPPLRQRPEDVLHLANHFLRLFAHQYEKPVRNFSGPAEAALLRHDWPGNVRELQNRLMQAVILCDDVELDVEGLRLPASSGSTATVRPIASSSPTFVTQTAADTSTIQPERGNQPREVLWETLEGSLGRQIDNVLGRAKPIAVPLGKWLSDDLVLEAIQAADGTARRAAEIVGIPETTFRRRLRQAEAQADAGLTTRLPSWEEVLSVLSSLVRADVSEDEDMLERGLTCLLSQIVARVGSDVRIGAGLLGVTAPTYRRRIADLERHANAS